jgi:hypothetical protein
MDPWYKIAIPRKEVREGRSFNPDEFAIALEQVVAGTAPEDYRNPEQFFARTYFSKALREHAGMVLRRLIGKTENTAPVLTLITQFGGGKTHTLAALYHLVRHAEKANKFKGVTEFLVWCIKRPGRDLREKIELWLAWKRVAREIVEGTLGSDFDRGDRAEIQSKVADAEEAAMGRISLCSSR